MYSFLLTYHNIYLLFIEYLVDGTYISQSSVNEWKKY